MENKKFVLGQYFTRKNVVEKVINLLLKYKKYDNQIRILEPSFGTGNFLEVLRNNGFTNIEGCEIDPKFMKNPQDFFTFSLKEKFDLIIGNPPFSKYNVKKSYYYPKKYFLSGIHPAQYITAKLSKKEKIQIENAFILKSTKHLKNENSSIAFVLPISFFIKSKNFEVKKELANKFSTLIIYQNDEKWVDEPIPCCFAIFTNIEWLKNKIVLLYENEKNIEEILDKSQFLTEELIPKSFLYKKNAHFEGISLSKILIDKIPKYKRSYTENNISASNIMGRNTIPKNKLVSNYCIAVARVGNVSVGRAGLINIEKDILNDMFYVFKFKEDFNKNKEIKEKICKTLNENQEHFRNLTFRVGSKSLKKDDILNFKIKI